MKAQQPRSLKTKSRNLAQEVEDVLLSVRSTGRMSLKDMKRLERQCRKLRILPMEINNLIVYPYLI